MRNFIHLVRCQIMVSKCEKGMNARKKMKPVKGDVNEVDVYRCRMNSSMQKVENELDLNEYGVQNSNTAKQPFKLQQGQMDREIIDIDDPEIIFIKHVHLICDSDDLQVNLQLLYIIFPCQHGRDEGVYK
jgi:hypothetical protein